MPRSIKEFSISPISRDLCKDLKKKIDSKTKPAGALGCLEKIAFKIGLIQQSLTPQLTHPAIAIFAGDHGIAADGVVNAYPREVTWQMVYNFLEGGAAINVFCRQHGLKAYIIDAGVDHDFEKHPDLVNLKVAKGTCNYRAEPAMSPGQCSEAMSRGVRLIGELHRKGTNIIGFGEMGIGNTSSASVITSLITGKPIEECVGQGSGLDERRVAQKTEALKEAIQNHNIAPEPLSILATFGGFEIAMMAAAMLRAASHRMILMIDGFIVTAALLIASELNRNVLDYTLFAHLSGERGHRIQLDYLGEKPLLNLGMRLGEGTGVAIAYPVIESAVSFLNNMASFESAGVSKGETREK